MAGNDVRIEQKDFRTARVFIDGNEVKGVQNVNYSIGVDEMPIIKLEFIPETLNSDKEQDKGNVELNITIDGQKIAETVVEQINEESQKEGNKEVII